MVVEDGAGEVDARPREKSGWVLAAVGFGLGLALGTLIAGPGELPGPTEMTDVTDGASSDDTAETSDDSSDQGVSGEVPEFPDALVAVADTVGSGHDYLLWPVAGTLVTRSMTGGGDVQLDSTGRFVALSEDVPDLPGLLLSMGRFNGMRPISSRVTSFEWHDSQAGKLAYTIENDVEWRLYRVTGGFTPSLVTTGTLEGGTVAAWGDWGYAIQLPDDRVRLLTPSGEPKDVESGVALASHESGWILVNDGELKLVSAGGGVRELAGSDVPETILAASFSPDGSRAGVLTRLGVVIVDLNDSEEDTLAPGVRGGWVTWSSDSRFVVAPASSGVSIYDVSSDESHDVLFGRDILVAQTSPLTSRRDG
jgi:hypothetical protein